MTLRAAAEQALNALDYAADRVFSEGDDDPIGEARAALRAALAAEHPQPEAVAWPKVNGTARMFDNARALMVIMEREPTDDEMRAFDDAIKGWGTSPPAAPEPSEAEVAAAMASLHRAMEPAAWPSEDEITDALRAAAAARNTNPA